MKKLFLILSTILLLTGCSVEEDYVIYSDKDTTSTVEDSKPGYKAKILLPDGSYEEYDIYNFSYTSSGYVVLELSQDGGTLTYASNAIRVGTDRVIIYTK